MMEFTLEWNVICRVCLQEGEMHSVFEEDDDVLISEKIMQCSSVKIERGVNLPENICTKCLTDLRIAYTFRSNCESSDAVLQSFVKGNIVSDLVISANGEIYKYKPPQGLKVKRIPKTEIKPEKLEDDTKMDLEEIEDVCELEDFEDVEQVEMPSSPQDQTSMYETSLRSDKDETNSQISDGHNLVAGKDYVIIDDGKNYFTVKINDVDNESISVLNSDNDLVINNKYKEKENVALETIKQRIKPPEVKINRQGNRAPKAMHICEICGNSYKHKHSLETHMRRHRNEKPFSCEICGRAFVLNVELKCHMRTHTGQKPYPCRFCGRRFSDFGSRIKHERTHTGERPYACDTCGKAFAYSYGLTSHMLTHTGEKPFECEKCGKRFAKKHHLKNHLNTHAKQENRLRSKGPPLLHLLTSDKHVDHYMDVNVVEIKQENDTRLEITEIPS